MSKNYGILQDKNGNTLIPSGMEVVTNSNGTALKFPDGTMIQYRTFAITQTKTEESHSVSLPVSFVDTNYVLTLTTRDVGFGFTYENCNIGYSTKTKSGFTAVFKMKELYSGTYDNNMIAIGRWK